MLRLPCVQPIDILMADNRHPNPPVEAPVGAVETDGGRKEAGREKNRFWKWPSLHFPCLRSGEYDLTKVEKKYGIASGTHSD
ncbi:hypothetical protein M9458_005737, partial [Cirrhinus mrigala]